MSTCSFVVGDSLSPKCNLVLLFTNELVKRCVLTFCSPWQLSLVTHIWFVEVRDPGSTLSQLNHQISHVWLVCTEPSKGRLYLLVPQTKQLEYRWPIDD